MRFNVEIKFNKNLFVFFFVIAGKSAIDHEKRRNSNEKSQIVVKIKEEEGHGWWLLTDRQSFRHERFNETIRSIKSIFWWIFSIDG